MKDKPQNSTGNPGEDGENGIWKDPRFAHLVSDPRFKNIHKSTKSVKIDSRFKSMFNDEKFKLKYTVDKYGRKVNKTSNDDLEKYYELSSEEDEGEEKRKEEEQLALETNENDALESEEIVSDNIKSKLKDLTIDYARGEVALMTDSSSDDESSDEEDEELFIEHVWGELDNDAPRTEDSTRRLAACNMDWDRIRASDIMVLCNSFLPPGGSILSVTIYPSEYGKQRLAEEEVKGPQELTKKKLQKNYGSDGEADNSGDDDLVASDDNEEGSDYHMEKLRQYQLNRLKYYYAVIECDSVRTADKLYAECDGVEYESTATKFDLRFIPDDMTFDDEPKEKCTELPELAKYKPRLFTTTALQQAKVELTWDENDVDRNELTEKLQSGKIDDIPDTELRRYVAYTSEEEEEEDEDEENSDSDKGVERNEQNVAPSKNKRKSIQSSFKEEDVSAVQPNVRNKNREKSKNDDGIAKYKALLGEINNKEEKKKNSRIAMEFSWGVGLNNEKAQESEKVQKPQELTPFEKIMEKKREKKRARKEHIKKLKKVQLHGSDYDENDTSDDDLPDGIDLSGPYFAEEFANGEFEDLKKKKSNKQKQKQKSNKFADKDTSGAGGGEAEKELALLLEDDDNKAHFSLKKIQEAENESKSRKRKNKLKAKKAGVIDKKLDDDFKMDVTDERFSALFKSHLFNIDPTDSHYRKTKGTQELIEEKLKRKTGVDGESTSGTNEPLHKKPKQNIADSILIKSIKRKVQQQK